uniref:Uncharacterized protein n=1 Tax=Chromera velia CCMP2878 TaxID=1169474 RepID=A0A0G4HHE1_9ALVE|eukprot:Cvel_27484.t1-p1 / transcript=Cvel_27484.t1 / gene=Cvel_27484 / organism=Chromera_velia_CCMP2878 / gene_product=hypothetical protein / transcript_product=hypothetical protein / location=Cvel_scaffold3436:14699-15855(-) / protein_length=150 / sequence_SO=supercontig / SO=protein_coding / is_pseudo=false
MRGGHVQARRGSVRIRARVYDRPWRVNASPSPSPSSPLHGPPKGSDPEEMESCLLQSFLGSDAARALRSTRSGESRPGGRVDGKSSLLSERKESFSVSELQNDGNLLIRAGSAVLKSQQSAQQEDKDPQKGQRIGNTLTVLANATKGGLR